VTGPIGEVLQLRLLQARQRLDLALREVVVEVEPEARDDMIESLMGRLARACGAVAARAHAAGGAGALAGALAAHRGLASLLDRIAVDWLAALVEMTSALEQDGPAVADLLFEGAPIRRLVRYRGDAGDAHGGGRTVSCLELEGGRRLVYKPKDLSVARVFGRLVRFLGEHGLDPALRTARLLVSGRRSWEELVVAAPCDSEGAVHRFYLRIGMQLRLMQLLEARDLWLDNLIAAGEQPVFIDLETLLQPRLRQPAGGSAQAADLLAESVAPLGILAMHTTIADGVPAEDLGAVAWPRPVLTPFPADPILDRLVGRDTESRDGYRTWFPRAHAPTLHGEPCRAADHLAAIQEGHGAMQACLKANRQRLLDDLLPRFRDCRVRAILRNTWAYQRIIDASLTPELLREEGVRPAALAASRWAPPGQWGALGEVFTHERAALSRLDVPYFLCAVDGTDLLDETGALVAGDVLEPTAYQRACDRLERIDDFPLADHQAMIGSVLGTGHASVCAPPHLGPSSLRVDWTEEAATVGEVVLGHSLRDRGRRVWIGLHYDPRHDFSSLRPLGTDLLGGNGAIAVALAELALATGAQRFREGAVETLLPVEESLAEPDGLLGLRGLGGRAYAVTRCRAVLMLPRAPALIEKLERAMAAIGEDDEHDLVDGGLGLGLAAVACGCSVDRIDRIERRATERAGQGDRFPARARLRAFLPSPGRALALLRHRRGGPLPNFGRGALSQEESGDALVDLAVSPPLSQEVRSTLGAVRQSLTAGRGPAVALASLALAAFHASGDEWFLERSRGLALAFVEGRRRHGRWLAESTCADQHQLSLLWGLPALIELFLGLADPARQLPSVRLLSPRPL
jgi:type 2 lantibiotic biosynthesis protein LanM